MKLWQRFWGSNLIALSYAGIGFYIAQWWIASLSDWTGSYVLSLLIVLFIAIIPGYLNILLLASLYFYKYEPANVKESDFPPVSILIAAYNEEEAVRETFRGLSHQVYPNEMEVIVVNDGSSDHTVDKLAGLHFPNLRIISTNHGGKAEALNVGLKECGHDIIVTIDADTFLHHNAIHQIVARILSDTEYAAVAGNVLVKNERMSRLARLQSWDYMLGISSVKREQGLFQGTLVAQGAFSAFRKSILLKLDGWQDRIGEDIVLTWALLKAGYKVGYEPTAFAFTGVPINFRQFLRQRQRWARGMIEGFKDHLNLVWRRHNYSAFFVAIDLFFPIIDFFYTFVFIPGLIMACFGHFHIVGLFTLLVIPINICIIAMMIHAQKKFLNYAGLKMRENPVGLALYAMVYQILVSPICVKGYFQEIFCYKRKW